jgi:hypothetical protein
LTPRAASVPYGASTSGKGMTNLGRPGIVGIGIYSSGFRGGTKSKAIDIEPLVWLRIHPEL